jgi:hypothetical protein
MNFCKIITFGKYINPDDIHKMPKEKIKVNLFYPDAIPSVMGQQKTT